MLKRKKKKGEEESASKVRQFVGFQVGTELYGIDIHCIQEIDRMHSITKLPKSLPFIEGVINLRDHIIPVIDMSYRFGQERIEHNRMARVIIARINDQPVGLIVERVSEVIQIEDGSIEEAPAMAFTADKKYVKGVGHVDEGLIILLDLETLLSPEEMSQLQQHRKTS